MAKIARIAAQPRTTDIDSSIRSYVDRPGMALAFRFEDSWAGIDAGGQSFHVNRADATDPSIADVRQGGLLSDTVPGHSRPLLPAGRPSACR